VKRLYASQNRISTLRGSLLAFKHLEELDLADNALANLDRCLDTLEQGVKKIHIIDGRLRHSLLLEIYTTSGVGTELIRDDVMASVSRDVAAAATR
jgi:acetylglutamate kinase